VSEKGKSKKRNVKTVINSSGLTGLTTILFIMMILSTAVSVYADSHGEIRKESFKTKTEDEPGVVYQIDVATSRPNRIAVMDVKDWGIITIELYDNLTPITTGNFVRLADSGFYEGIKFHRCIDDFVAQTGDPNTKDNNPYNDGMGGSGETIPLELHPNATHVDGAVGMARSEEPDTASSQFYICDGPQHGLDDKERMQKSGSHGYAVFGRVIDGLPIAKNIAGTETYGNRRPLLKDHPVDDIVITSVTIITPEPENYNEQQLSQGNASFIERLSEVTSGPWGALVGVDMVVVVLLILWVAVFRKRE